MTDCFTAYEGSEPYVFVSYAHKDTDIVLPLIRGLHDRGVRIWYDGGVEVGSEWPDFIAEHLEGSGCVLAFVSRNFGDSHNCRREINFAIEERKEPIVIYLEPRELLKAGMRMQLGSLHALFYERYENPEEFLDALMKAAVIQPCIGPAKETAAQPESVPFQTIDFDDDDETVQVVMPQEDIVGTILCTSPEVYYANACERDAEGRYAEAAMWYRRAAVQGHAKAQNALGLCYEQGKGEPRDLPEAVRWYRLAAEQGEVLAQMNLGMCYEYGKGVEIDLEAALAWYRMAAAQNLSRAAEAVARVEAALKEKAGEWYEMAHDCIRKGNPGEALKLYQKAAEYGYADAQNRLGNWYLMGESGQKDKAKAVDWFRKAAEQGHGVAQVNLAICYAEGEGTVQDLAEAFGWYRKAAEQGNAIAMLRVAKCYERGMGVETDLGMALMWYRKAAEQGNVGADRDVARVEELLNPNRGTPEEWHQKAQKLYLENRHEEAVKWYRKAAERGYEPAQYGLGRCYFYGHGVAKDDREAVAFFRMAAQPKQITKPFIVYNAKAQYWMGYCYENGCGVDRNLQEALRWYRMAKENEVSGFESVDEAIVRCEKALKKPWWKK